MGEHRQTTRFLVGFAVVGLLGACSSGSTPTPSSAPTASASPSVAAATPAPTALATPAPASAGSGHVIHVNLVVPLTSAAPVGSTCNATALRETGPVAATIPGSPVQLFDFNRWDVPPPAPGATRQPLKVVGEQAVPAAGTVVEAIIDDPGFPAACRFTFDVPTTADVKTAYLVSIGRVYFPLPLMHRDALEAAGWIADIGVNPQ
jgi:hypothetical protein